MEKKAQRNFLWVALLALGTIGILARHNRAVPYQTVSGLIFGTVYNITYQYDSNLKAEIEAELKRFDGSLSPFNDTATITRINRNEEIIPDTFFTNVFRRSMEISRETQGAFDITVAPLANAWGFGFKKGAFPDSAMIDSLLDITRLSESIVIRRRKSYQTGFPHHAFVQRRSQRLCSRCHCAIAGKERHRQFHGRYRRRSGGARRKPEKKFMAHRNQQADRRLARRKPGIADHTASYRCGHSHFGKLPKLLLQRGQKICPYYRPAHRLSGAAQYPGRPQ